ncbi:MAG: tetratricopeptide repeat protein [Candidatus Omnitrophica bacterium]|nr:tetratricopeptide repeat protein [Candidatus Omnitrophota bacterium]
MSKTKILFFLGIFSSIVYFNSIFNPFIFDDYGLIIENTFIKNFKYLKLLFTTNLYEGAGEKTLFYRPLQSLSYALIYKFFKLNPIPYHLLNIFLHIGCSILFFLLLKEIYGERIAFLSSLLWAIHPINTEAVTYIAGLADPLFLFFGLLGIYFYKTGKKFLTFIFFIFSLISKETGILILPLFFLYLYSTEKIKRQEIKNYVGITLIFIIYLILRQTILNFGKGQPEDIFIHRFYTAFHSFLIYISILIFPFILSMERHIPYIKTAKNLDFITGFIFFLFFIWFIYKKRTDKRIFFAGTLFLLNFLFHSNILIPLNGNLREHWMYMGGIGFFVYFVILIEMIKKGNLKKVLLILVFSLYGIRTILRNYDWNDPVKFYERTMKYFSVRKEIISNYAFTLLSNKKYEKALLYFKSIYFEKPDDWKTLFGIAKCYLMLGNYDFALKYYYEGIKIKPDKYDIFVDIALIYEKKGDVKKVIEILENLIKKEKEFQAPYILLGKIYLKQKNYELSKKYFEKSLELNPDEIISLKNLAKIYQLKGEHEKAIHYFERAIKIDPDDIYILNDYAISLSEIGEVKKAIKILKRILKRNPAFKPARINLEIIQLKNKKAPGL